MLTCWLMLLDPGGEVISLITVLFLLVIFLNFKNFYLQWFQFMIIRVVACRIGARKFLLCSQIVNPILSWNKWGIYSFFPRGFWDFVGFLSPGSKARMGHWSVHGLLGSPWYQQWWFMYMINPWLSDNVFLFIYGYFKINVSILISKS